MSDGRNFYILADTERMPNGSIAMEFEQWKKMGTIESIGWNLDDEDLQETEKQSSTGIFFMGSTDMKLYKCKIELTQKGKYKPSVAMFQEVLDLRAIHESLTYEENGEKRKVMTSADRDTNVPITGKLLNEFFLQNRY